MSVLADIEQQTFGYVTVRALSKIVDVTMYYDQEDRCLGAIDPMTLLYFEITNGICFVMGYTSEYGDCLTFGILPKSKGVHRKGNNVILSIIGV